MKEPHTVWEWGKRIEKRDLRLRWLKCGAAEGRCEGWGLRQEMMLVWDPAGNKTVAFSNNSSSERGVVRMKMFQRWILHSFPSVAAVGLCPAVSCALLRWPGSGRDPWLLPSQKGPRCPRLPAPGFPRPSAPCSYRWLSLLTQAEERSSSLNPQ